MPGILCLLPLETIRSHQNHQKPSEMHFNAIAAIMPFFLVTSQGCEIGQIGHGDLQCNSPYLKVNYYDDNHCGRYIAETRYYDQSKKGACVPTNWNGVGSAIIANWNYATKDCVLYTQSNCGGAQVQLYIAGPTQNQRGVCATAPAGQQFESMRCFW